MLSVKNELLEALAASLEKLSPGSGAKAAFESPKVAAHGDLATTAAMQRNTRFMNASLSVLKPHRLRGRSRTPGRYCGHVSAA